MDDCPMPEQNQRDGQQDYQQHNKRNILCPCRPAAWVSLGLVFDLFVPRRMDQIGKAVARGTGPQEIRQTGTFDS